MKKPLIFKRRGFTLIELLIVIIIIGVLAGMIMTAAGAATDKAKAARIIADVRTMKAAAVLYQVEYGSWPLWASKGGAYSALAGTKTTPDKYVGVNPVEDDYWVGSMVVDNKAFAVAQLTSSISDGVKRAIAAQAESVGLYGLNGTGGMSTFATDETSRAIYTINDDVLIMIISK